MCCWLGLTRSDGLKFSLTELCKSAKMGDTFFVRNATWVSLCGSMTYSGVWPSPMLLFFGVTHRISNSKGKTRISYSMLRFCPKNNVSHNVTLYGLCVSNGVTLYI